MLKFKRVNTMKLARKKNLWIYQTDLLRQTTVERYVERFGKLNGVTKKQLISNMIFRIEEMLNLMVVEEEK